MEGASEDLAVNLKAIETFFLVFILPFIVVSYLVLLVGGYLPGLLEAITSTEQEFVRLFFFHTSG